MITRIRGNASPISFEISNADGTVFDGSSYSWLLAIVEVLDDGNIVPESASPFYVVSPTAGSWDAPTGLVVFDLPVATWNLLEADKKYMLQCEGNLPGSPVVPTISLQQEMLITRTAIARA